MAPKRKNDDELSRFVWKRNIKYDLLLLSEVELYNPCGLKNQTQVWISLAETLQEGPLKMKVTARSCRDRVHVHDLLNYYRKDQLNKIQSPRISEEDSTKMQILIAKVAKLEEAKPKKQLKGQSSKKDNVAEAERSLALKEIVEESSDEDDFLEKGSDEYDSFEKGSEKKDDFEFGPTSGSFQSSNPRNKLFNYLEKKSESELKLKEEELRLREREADNKAKELEIMQLKAQVEIESKAKELEIMQLKAQAEVDEKKKFMDLVLHLATRKPSE